MQRAIKHQILKLRIWVATAAILVAAIPASGQESKSSWKLKKSSIRGFDISTRSEIASPQGAGFATLMIKYQPTVTPPAIVYLFVESPKQLPLFPFVKYDGPVDRTEKEFIKFEVAPEDPVRARTVKVMPDGYYGDTPPGAFVFDTIEKRVVSFLSKVKDGQKLIVTVNGPPSSIQVAFDTTGLKKLLDQVGLKAVAGGPRASHLGQVARASTRTHHLMNRAVPRSSLFFRMSGRYERARPLPWAPTR